MAMTKQHNLIIPVYVAFPVWLAALPGGREREEKSEVGIQSLSLRPIP